MGLLQTILPVLLTAFLGTRIAHGFQNRAAKESRFFEASRGMYGDMITATDKITALVGKRIYAAQRFVLTSPESEHYKNARNSLRDINIEWNEKLLEMEMSVRTLFRDSHLTNFENMQARMAMCLSKIGKMPNELDKNQRNKLLKELQIIRSEYFSFIREMHRECSKLHRQMHFGVAVEYDPYNLGRLSNWVLVKLLFKSSIEAKRVICAPTDFGMPVDSGEARLGIYE